MTLQVTDFVPALKRAVAPPGEFDSLFPDAGDDDMLGYLLDGIAESQLDGFFTTINVAPDGTSDTDLTSPMGALAIIYASSRVLQQVMRNMNTKTAYKAGPVSYEVDQSASVMAELLREAVARKAALLKLAQTAGAGETFIMADIYQVRAGSWATDPYGVLYAGILALGYAPYDLPYSGGVYNFGYDGAP